MIVDHVSTDEPITGASSRNADCCKMRIARLATTDTSPT